MSEILSIESVMVGGGLVVAGLLARTFLPTYLTEKAKNLATKEDVGELTRRVEDVRTRYQGEIERLRADLDRASLIHRSQYEAESKVYEEVWQRLVEVHQTVQSLRPALDHHDPKETKEERKLHRLRQFGDAFNALQSAIVRHRPFYSSAVYQELRTLMRLAHNEAIDFQYGDASDGPNYWKEALANSDAIGRQVEAVCESIRHRLSGSGVG